MAKTSTRFREFFINIKRSGLLTSTIAVVALVNIINLMPLYSENAFASSIYDDVIKSLDSIKVEGVSGEVDVTNTYGSLMSLSCGSTFYNSFKAAVDGGGDWAIVNFDEGSGKRVRVIWSSTANSLTAQFGMDSPSVKYLYLTGTVGYVQFGRQSNGSPVCDYATTPTSLSYVVLSQSSFSSDEGIFANTFNVSYPSGYEGVIVSDQSTDVDGDGLNAARELFQGTSDNAKDTDEDGLNDYVESRWYPYHDSAFCDTSTPKHCAEPHPTAKDVYVEMDWMNDGTTSYKPTDIQVGLVSDAFAAKDIYLHADTGQYGGGNQLATYAAPLSFEKGLGTDYFDYKDGNFSSARQGIWRYMISGDNYSQAPNSSGATYPGSDNIFISNGYIRDHQSGFGYTDLDTALAGTMIHEIGHSLCLSGVQQYSYQHSICIYGGVDAGNVSTNSYSNYASSMNYYNQMGMVDYSNGSNSAPGDHNDWFAVKNFMPDFTSWDYDTDADYGVGLNRKPKMSVAITTETAKKLKDKGLLKTGKVSWKHLQVRKH